jgi:hypothetical protein
MIERNPYLTALGTVSLGLIALAIVTGALGGGEFAVAAFGFGASAGLLWLAVAALVWYLEHRSTPISRVDGDEVASAADTVT